MSTVTLGGEPPKKGRDLPWNSIIYGSLIILSIFFIVLIGSLFVKEKFIFAPPKTDKIPSNYTNVIDRTKVIMDGQKLMTHDKFFFPGDPPVGRTFAEIQEYLADPNNLKFLSPKDINDMINSNP